MLPETKSCQNCHTDFTIEPDDFSFYEKIKVPPPTWCPECRLVRRLRIRNERSLFRAQCGLCGKNVVTMYNPENGFTVYCTPCYISDAWDPLQHGREYDFSKPFFEQFAALMKVVPRKAVHSVGGGKDTEYSNYLVNSSESLLSYSTVGSEKIYYCRVVDTSKECVDCSNIKDCESCYGLIQGVKNYGSAFLIDSRNCIDSRFLYDCSNCSNCFMSANLRNKQYVFRGEQLTKEAYEKAFENMDTGSSQTQEECMQEFRHLIEQVSIHRFSRIFKSENCTGDYIENSRNVRDSFEVFKAENARYSLRLTDGPTDIYDVTGSGRSQLLYEGSGAAWGSQNSAFFSSGSVTVDSQYCDFCMNVSHVFGSISVSHKQYVILNKQYTKEEYFELLPKIKQHMQDQPYLDEQGRVYQYGEFFPQICIPHSYNESTAQEYFPLTKEEIIQKGYLWRDQEAKNYEPTQTKATLPDSINAVNNDFIEEVIACAHEGSCKHLCTEAFRLHPDELRYLKKWNLPIPRLCPNCRHYERLGFRTLLKLYSRSCMCDLPNHDHEGKCPNEFETAYVPDRPEKVYCETCYQKEVL
jgi:hypothetical protein